MKTLTRTTLASVAVLSVLAACAPSRRATNKPTAAPASPANAAGIAPFQNTTIVNANARLPIPTDTNPAGTINLMTTTKDQPLVVNLDNNLNATSTSNQLSNLSFKCTTVPAQATLDKCADMELDLTLTGTDNQPHAVQVLVSRRGQVNVDEKIIDPKNPNATGAPENPKFDTGAFYQATQTSVDKNAFHVFELAYIKTPAAKPTDLPEGTGIAPVGTANQVAFYIQGALVDTAGNPVTCVQADKNGVCGPDTKVSSIDSTTKNLIKSFSIKMSDGTSKTVLLTVQDRNTSDSNALPNGSIDTSTMVSTVLPPTSSGSNPAPTTPAAPTTPTTPSTPASPATMGSVSSGGSPQAMTQKPAAPSSPTTPPTTTTPSTPTSPASSNGAPNAAPSSADSGFQPQPPPPNS